MKLSNFKLILIDMKVLPGNTSSTTLVMIPKLLPPPFRAQKRPGLLFGLALTIVLFARTISNSRTVSQAQPWCSEKNEIPPSLLISFFMWP